MARVLILGNAGLDLGLGLPRLPQRGETLLGHGTTRAPGGKGLNQAVTAARSGAQVMFRAPVGQDPEGDWIADVLAGEGFVGLDLPRLPHPTDFSILMTLPDGESCIASAGPCAAALAPEDAAGFAAAATPGDVLLLQGNLTRAATEAALVAGADCGARTVLNPAPLWWEARPLLPLCRVVVVNRVEAEAITGQTDPRAAAAWMQDAGAGLVLVTLGAEGCLAAAEDGVRFHPAVPVTAVDTTGCGDTFCGVLAAMLADGRDLDAAVSDAQRAASLTARRPGAYAALPSRDEMGVLHAGRGSK